jgi:hypothetical protein
MKTSSVSPKTEDLYTPSMNALGRQMRRLKKAQRTIDRKAGRIKKQYERSAYEWAALGL